MTALTADRNTPKKDAELLGFPVAANAKIFANEVADKIEANLKYLREHAKDHTALFPDTAQIVLKAPDDLQALATSRIAQHKAAEQKRLDDERERIRAEEQARADREARDRLAAEQAAQPKPPRSRPPRNAALGVPPSASVVPLGGRRRRRLRGDQ